MAHWIGIGRRARRCYGFDDVAPVPVHRHVALLSVEIALQSKLLNLKLWETTCRSKDFLEAGLLSHQLSTQSTGSTL